MVIFKLAFTNSRVNRNTLKDLPLQKMAGIEIIVDCLMGQGYKRNGTDKRNVIEGKEVTK